MENLCLFSCGLEQADLMVSSGLLTQMCKAILDTQPVDSTFHFVKYQIHPYSPNGTIITFVSSPESAFQGGDLISSDELKASSFNVFDFIGTKVNPSFSIHRGAVTVFHALLAELTQLKDQFCRSNPLIITGQWLGGSIASLFTLWLLDTIPPTSSKGLLCVTFGSPLLGDKSFQQAVSERPTWNASFLHVVSNKDSDPYLFIDSRNPQSGIYRPFGTYLILCSDSFSASCFEEPESIFELLVAVGSNPHNRHGITDYELILDNIMRKSIFKGASIMNNDDSLSNLQAGILMQLKAVGVETQENGVYLNSLAKHMMEREKNFLTRKKNMFDPNRRLTNRKEDMTYLEWYKKASTDQGGYYDTYKNKQSKSREQSISKDEIRKRHKSLTSYWRKMVDEAQKMPQKEGASFRNRYLYAGSNYRRMVEPLDIADYYKKGQRDYVTRGRSQHYKLLEKWFDEDSRRTVEATKERKNASSLTEDSCFWAHVEEATISCKLLRDGQATTVDTQGLMGDLLKFENYVMGLVNNFALSPEVFLPQSSFMQWWKEYSMVRGSSYDSPLAVFMRNGYKNYA